MFGVHSGLPTASLSAVLTPVLGSANYTAVRTSGDGTTGLSFFEFYGTDSDGAPALVRNLALRGNIAPETGVLIGRGWNRSQQEVLRAGYPGRRMTSAGSTPGSRLGARRRSHRTE